MDETTGLRRFEEGMRRSGVSCEIIDAGSHTLTVSQAEAALGVDVDQIIKTLLFHDGNGNFVIAIASGLNRIDARLLADQVGFGPLKLAKPAVVLEALGYPAGGVPPLGLPGGIPMVIDTQAAALETCVGGAGSVTHLARFRVADVARLNNARIASITTNGH